MKHIKTDRARAEFGTVVNRVAYGGERIVLERRGKPMAAMIPMEDLALLERLIEREEDRIDLERARAAMAEAGPSIPLEAYLKERGIGGQKGRTRAGGAAKLGQVARG
jgi:prevent-host-death family protein